MRHITPTKIIAATSAPFILAACAGGSGGSSMPEGPGGTGGIPSYATLDLKAGSGTTKIKGTGREGLNTIVPPSSGTRVEEYWGDFSPAEDNSVEITTDAAGKITAIVMNTPSGSRSWDSSDSAEYVREDDYAEGYKAIGERILVKNDEDFFLVADPASEGFEYQTFGMWARPVSENLITTGTFSVGSETARADIPTSGAATFKGRAFAQWSDSKGEKQDIMTADATLQADFARRSAAFSTTNSAISLGGVYPGLDMNGTLNYGTDSDVLSGPVTTAGGMTGTVDGKFFGPGAKEVGGVFFVSGSGYESLFGGFGAVRQ